MNDTTTHNVFFKDSRKMDDLPSDSVHLVVTSPPYPMIEMWDELFSKENPKIETALKEKDAQTAFELMHQELDQTWLECYRVLKEGGFACINIGDATRTIDKRFKLYDNHSRITSKFQEIGFDLLPKILWQKTTNKPNKFMGSGMLPSGAYVTLEHEYILIFRKGSKRLFTTSEEKAARQKSAYFWEERNKWFSDIWTGLNGIHQKSSKTKRKRTGAYPFNLAYRLINMYSIQGDTVLDPYLGTGTTTLASMISGRNSIGYEIDDSFEQTIQEKLSDVVKIGEELITHRLKQHADFMTNREKESKHYNAGHGVSVITRQEKEITLTKPNSIANNNADSSDCRSFTVKLEKVSDFEKQKLLSNFNVPSV